MTEMRNTLKLFILLFVPLLVMSCSASSEETVPDYDVAPSENSFDGLQLVFNMKPDICYDVDSLFGDLVRTRIADVEKQFDIDIVFDESDNIDNNLFYYLSSGIKPCDVMLSDSNELYYQIRAGLLFPVDNFYTGLDYLERDKWGGREKLISYAYDNHLYGILPMYWPETVWKQVDHFFFVNENMVGMINQPDPREFVENGEWTRAKYEEILEEYTHQNNNGQTVYALAAVPGHYFSIAIKSSGIDYIVKHSDGSWSNAFFEPGVVDKLTWITDTFWNNWERNIVSGTDTFTTIAKFVNEETVMVLTHLYWGLADIQYTVDNFGLLPFPLSDDLVGSGWISQFEFYNNGISFPANITELEAIPTIVNAIFEPLPGYETEDDRLQYYDRYVFHDPRDTRLVFECLENCHYLPFIDSGYLIPNALTDARGKVSVSQLLESHAEIMQVYIDKVYIPLEETCDLLWGEN